MLWEERGGFGERLVRNQLAVIARVPRSAAARLVTAAVPRELRIDSRDKKSRRDET